MFDAPDRIRDTAQEGAMRLSEVMSRRVKTVPTSTPIERVREEMERRRIHHLVVMAHGQVAGVVSSRDLDRRTDARTAAEAMSGDPVFASPSTTVRRAANVLRGRGIGCLPVIEDGRVCGIVTVSDLLEIVGRSRQFAQRRPGSPLHYRTLRRR
jgi:acetoin utilization protein AcuB